MFYSLHQHSGLGNVEEKLVNNPSCKSVEPSRFFITGSSGHAHTHTHWHWSTHSFIFFERHWRFPLKPLSLSFFWLVNRCLTGVVVTNAWGLISVCVKKQLELEHFSSRFKEASQSEDWWEDLCDFCDKNVSGLCEQKKNMYYFLRWDFCIDKFYIFVISVCRNSWSGNITRAAMVFLGCGVIKTTKTKTTTGI